MLQARTRIVLRADRKDTRPPRLERFDNQSLYDYCRQGGITFTRSRAWKKNDSAHVEQKHGAVVRVIGYDRFAPQAAYAQLRRVYRLGACVRRVYDRAQTPYQRRVPPASSRPLPA
jgi:hypothetical protein